MEQIPMEWVDKLFTCMQEFYGERWEAFFGRNYPEELQKVIWQSGLVGLTYEQIRKQLIRCKRHAADSNAKPPHVIAFYSYARRC